MGGGCRITKYICALCGCSLATSHTLKNDDKTSKTENFKEFQL